MNNVFSDAIDADFSNLKFEKIIIKNAKNDCIDLSSGKYYIKYAELSECGDKAISVGEKSTLIVGFSKISSSEIGLASKDSSVVRANSVVAENVTTCFSAYNKKQEYFGAKISVDQHNCHPNQFFQQEGSLIEVVQ